MNAPALRRQRGLTVIELLVALVIGLILTLAIVAILTRGEGLRRTTTTLNDLNQTSSVVSYMLDRDLRSAGSGYAQRWRETFGCLLFAARDGTQILPRAAAFPAPFENVTGNLRLAPVLIGQGLAPGTGGDVLIVMSGTSGFSEAPMRINTGSATTTSVLLPTSLGVRPNDLVLVADAGLGQCMLQQVTNAFTPGTDQLVDFGGRYAASNVGAAALSGFSTTGQSYAVMLGNAANNFPQFRMIGVGANGTLFGYDLLRQADADAPVAIADGVVEMRALYGVDANDNGAVEAGEWVDPADTAAFGLNTLLDGSAASQANLRRIASIRVGMIVRTALPEREAVMPASITLFDDLAVALQQTRNLTADERLIRHRVVDFTVPLRNLQLQPTP